MEHGFLRQDLRILVAGAPDAERAFIQTALLARGLHQVCATETVASALAVSQAYAPDLILVGIDIPPVGGAVLTQILREFLPDATIVAFDPFPTRQSVCAAIAAGVDDFIRLPTTPDRFLDRLERLLRSAATVRTAAPGTPRHAAARDYSPHGTGWYAVDWSGGGGEESPLAIEADPLLSKAEITALLGRP